MFIEILIAVFLGIFAGIITGLTPGIHVNLVSVLLYTLSGFLLGFANPLSLAVFIIAMSVTHTFLDSIPSIFLGAPDPDMALSVLPGHRLLLEGKGFEAVKLTVIGSLLALVATVGLIPILLPLVPLIYSTVQPFMGYILLFVVVYMILIEKKLVKIVYSVILFILTGVLGLITINWPNLQQPLFPLLSGLFGTSTLLLSIGQTSKLPKQSCSETIKIKKSITFKAISAAVFSGSLTGIFPGLGAAQASIIGMNLVGDIKDYGFMILIGGINTVNFTFSLATLYALEKARNGAVVVVSQLLSVGRIELVVLLCAGLIAGGVATYLALGISKVAATLITKINYKVLVISIISLITLLTLVLSGIVGLMILIVSTAAGMIAPLVGVKRSHAMGCLMLPVILFFML
ncbi:MAG: tripartite tricarboxylate transporter permease [Nanoarchaeota archaeon]|nr:tripartite tricarboxylate transporter permease [Nanoarchaeota archaeon]